MRALQMQWADLLIGQGEPTIKTAGWLNGEPAPFVFVANFYSLQTKKITAESMVSGDWLGCCMVSTWVGIFAQFRVRKLAGKG